MDGARALLALALAVLLMPGAAAQASQPQLVITAEDALVYVEPATLVTLNFTLRYVASPPDHTDVDGIRVRYEVVEAPAWANVTLAPEEDVVLFERTASTTQERELRFAVVAAIAGNALDQAGPAERRMLVRATSEPSMLLAAGEAELEVVLHPHRAAPPANATNDTADAASRPSIRAAAAQRFAPQDWTAVADEPLVTQSRHADDISGGEGLFLLLCAATGALAAHRLRRRLANR